MPNYQVSKLENGLTLITYRNKNIDTVYFDLAIKVGSKDENKKNNGISHLTEHLLFRKAIDSLNKHQWIKHYINDTFSAYTKQERTNFEFQINKGDLDMAINLLAEIISSEGITEKMLQQEKEIILEELKGYQDDFLFHHDNFVKQNYYQNNSLSFEIIGNERTLKNINLKSIKKFIKENYTSKNIILTIAGNFAEKEMKLLLNKKLKLSSDKNVMVNNNFLNFGKSKIFFNDLKSSQNYFTLQFSSLNKNARENVKREFLVEILNNYLFYSLQNKISTYFFNCDLITYSNITTFFIESSFIPNKTVKFYSSLIELLQNFKNNFSEKDFKYYQNKKQASLRIDRSNFIVAANMLGWYTLTFGEKQVLSISEQEKNIQKITYAEIMKIFDELFGSKKGSLFISGALLKKEKSKILKISDDYWV